MSLTGRRSLLAALAVGAVGALLLLVLGTSHSVAAREQHATAHHHAATAASSREDALRTGMRALWEQHMEWTYATVSAFAGGSPALQPTLARLLRNQAAIGDAVTPFYGAKAGNRLTALLKTHIDEAVPVLVAAKAGDTAGLNRAAAAWYANAQQIADFLAAANPHWKKAQMRRMMKAHITQTTAYASDILGGDYAKAIRDYDRAEAHMLSMADMLTAGLVAQFPQKF